MHDQQDLTDDGLASEAQSPLAKANYKFQRLRDQIRQAVTNGELSGKLPGERRLAQRFRCNAKTLSKALTDLAAEGLLQRSIGRGTFVRGHQAAPVKTSTYLLTCDPAQATTPLIESLRAGLPALRIEVGNISRRPSFINQFDGVIDLTGALSEDFVRDLMVRNIPVVTVDHEPRPFSTHAVLLDASIGITHLTRRLLQDGHRQLCAIERRGRTTLAETMRSAARRYAKDASVDACLPDEAGAAIESGIRAIVCDSVPAVRSVFLAAQRLGMDIPGQVAIAAVGYSTPDHAPCTGYFVSPDQQSEAIQHLLRTAPAYRPATIWLAGQSVELGTMSDPDRLTNDMLARTMNMPLLTSIF